MNTWDRATLKNRAKSELSVSLMLSFLVSLVGGFLANTSSTFNSNLNIYGNVGRQTYNIGSALGIVRILIPWGFLFSIVALAYVFFVAGPIAVGTARHFVQSPKGDRQFSNLFWAFSQPNYIRIATTMFVYHLIILVGAILFVIPGIIFYYMYRMVPYILAQEPDMSVGDALRLSSDMTRGDRMNIFVLDLSFIGWYLLFFLMIIILSPLIIILPPVALVAGAAIGVYMSATYAQLYGALTYKVRGYDPLSGGGNYPPGGGYPPSGDSYTPGGDGYQWGSGQQEPGQGTPPPHDSYPGSGQSGYTPPPPPPYGRHTNPPEGQTGQDATEDDPS